MDYSWGANYLSPAWAHQYAVKDSGKRHKFKGGMERDTTENKIDWSLVADGPMLRRYAEHLTKGAQKYAPRNWMNAGGVQEYERFRESAFRHFMQWWHGEDDEDHAAATWFNINGAEYLVPILNKPKPGEIIRLPA